MRSLVRSITCLVAIVVSTNLVFAESSTTVGTLVDPMGDKKITLLKGAKIHTMGSLGVMESADLLIVDNIIQEIGTGLVVPDGAEVIDVTGKEITPGLFNVSTALGLVEISAVKSTVDSRNTDKSYSASLSIADVINPDSSLWAHNRMNGLTHAVVKPSNSKSLFDGQGSVIKLSNGMDHLILRDAAAYMTYGDRAAELAGGTRALALQMIKAVFADLQKMTEAEDVDKYKPKSNLKLRELKALLPVITESKPVVVNAHRANDILAMLALAKQYALTMIIAGAEEAWMVKDQIAEAKVALILNPYSNLPNSFEKIGNRIDQMSLLHEAGIPMMISNSSSHNAYVIRQIAGNAVAYGLPHEVALASMTKTPAQWFGMDNLIGTIESGMQADLVVWDGDPLEITTSADMVYVGGNVMPMTSRQTKLRDRYLNVDERRPGYRH